MTNTYKVIVWVVFLAHFCRLLKLFDVLLSSQSCSHSLSVPELRYSCLLIACASIPAVKFHTSLKPLANP